MKTYKWFSTGSTSLFQEASILFQHIIPEVIVLFVELRRFPPSHLRTFLSNFVATDVYALLLKSLPRVFFSFPCLSQNLSNSPALTVYWAPVALSIYMDFAFIFVLRCIVLWVELHCHWSLAILNQLTLLLQPDVARSAAGRWPDVRFQSHNFTNSLWDRPLGQFINQMSG